MTPRQRVAIDWVLKHEGGFVDDPRDPGGATNYGLSLRWLNAKGLFDEFDIDRDGDLDADDVRQITRAQAAQAYAKHFWHPVLDDLAPPLAIELFDAMVNMGKRQAIRILQRASNETLEEHGPAVLPLLVDGYCGPLTAERVRAQDRIHLRNNFESQQAKFYYALCDARDGMSVFLLGWLRRCYDRPDAVLV